MIIILTIVFILLIVIAILWFTFKPERMSIPHKIIVTLTTIPERLSCGKLEKTLDSIYNQTLKPDIVIINIPLVTLKGKKYDPVKLKNLEEKYPNIIINRVPDDFGPITKIVPTLKFVNDNDKIVIIDDDVVYDEKMIYKLYNSNLQAVGFCGREGKDLTWYHNFKDTPMLMDFLETFDGVMYSASILKNLKPLTSDECIFQDDIVIGKYLKKNNVPVYIINSTGINNKHDGDGTPELRDINLVDGNKKCIDYLNF